MSLHLANLSPHIRKNELERVFRGFGRCTVQLKDGYGFAVYDFHENAEKALRTLKGRKICGHSIFLSWSNKQPKQVQRFARFGRNSGRDGDFRDHNFPSGHGGYPASDKHLQARGRERYHCADDDRENFNINDSEMHTDPVEGVLKESGHVEVEHNRMDNGRWGEQDEHLQNDSNYFDKRGEEYENRGFDPSASSQSAGTSPERRRLHSNNNRGKQTCFNCGTPGHRMCDYPSRENTTYQVDHCCDAKAKSEVMREDSRSRGWLQSSRGHSRLTRRTVTDRNPVCAGKVEITGRRSPVENESRRDMREDINHRKRRGGDDQIVQARDKRSRHLALSHLHSSSISPELDTLSRSKKALVGTSCHSRSASPLRRSFSGSSRSKSSRSPSSSSFLSLGQYLPSSPNKEQISLNGFSEGAMSPQSKELPNKVGKHFEPEVREENLSIANTADQSLSRNAENISSFQLMKVPINSKQHENDSQTSTSTKDTEISLNDIVEDDQIIQNQEAVPKERQGLESEPVEKSSGKVVCDMKLGQLHNDVDSNSATPQLYCEVEAPSLLENDKETSDVKMAALNPRTEENTNAIETTNQLEPASSKLCARSHLSISTEELSMVLKHYGLKHPEDCKQHLHVGDYFGSSRLWPWEMIYYRRLKKGPISVENYARRVVQNKEFNITDKYIRSSSGWGELIEEHDTKELDLF